jgi:anti-anti-sigma factor
MDITELHEGNTGVLALSGALDSSSAPALTIRAFALCDAGARAIIIDLDQVPHLTSAGFRSFIAIKRRAAETSIVLLLCGLNDVARELFEIGGMLGSFTIVPDRASALASIDDK